MNGVHIPCDAGGLSREQTEEPIFNRYRRGAPFKYLCMRRIFCMFGCSYSAVMYVARSLAVIEWRLRPKAAFSTSLSSPAAQCISFVINHVGRKEGCLVRPAGNSLSAALADEEIYRMGDSDSLEMPDPIAIRPRD